MLTLLMIAATAFPAPSVAQVYRGDGNETTFLGIIYVTFEGDQPYNEKVADRAASESCKNKKGGNIVIRVRRGKYECHFSQALHRGGV